LQRAPGRIEKERAMPTRTHEWDLWYPHAGATGLPFARGRLDPSSVLLVHAAPPALSVSVRDAEGRLIAEGRDLEASDDTPIARLSVEHAKVTREDIWPGEADIGSPVLLPGGEVGMLKAWWHAEDRSEWRWQIELYNRR
jgi:hypothetical protein